MFSICLDGEMFVFIFRVVIIIVFEMLSFVFCHFFSAYSSAVFKCQKFILQLCLPSSKKKSQQRHQKFLHCVFPYFQNTFFLLSKNVS